MQALIRRIFSKKILPLSWTILIFILLCLPGSMVPGTGLFGMEGFDKMVHVVLFGCNVLFWGWHYQSADLDGPLRKKYQTTVILTVLLGIALEFVQMYWVPNRTFDGYDIVADTAGAVAAGLWLWLS